MIVTKTVDIPESYRLTIDVPREIPVGKTIISFTPFPESVTAHECSVCAQNIDPVTGNPRYNAETIVAIEEGISISHGKIHAKQFNSLAEMLEDLDRDESSASR